MLGLPGRWSGDGGLMGRQGWGTVATGARDENRADSPSAGWPGACRHIPVCRATTLTALIAALALAYRPLGDHMAR
ncbi:hypothetical protein, partial [Streptomyces parvus]|uniref:hypothetical protein n=1 Tax=Streptomyces parvus TaxID=66428 RepID=UPI003324A130